ncbi:MAG: glycosyltransferase [Muribaculaceae bacterium]|nr:glycosyltransferase [Muribaculaceae bacterium]
MKILFIITDMNIGGAQRLLADMLPRLASVDDLEITLLQYDPIVNTPISAAISRLPAIRRISIGIPLSHAAAINPLVRMRAIRRLRAIMRRFDICHVNLFPALYDAAIAARGLKTRLVFTDHSTSNRRRRPIIRPLERLIHSRYDALTAVSPASARSLADWLRLSDPDRMIHVVDNGIVLSRFLPPRASDSESTPLADDHSDLFDRYNAGIEGEMKLRMQRAGIKCQKEVFGRDGLPLLMVSRLVESKNHDALVRAIRLLTTDERYTRRLRLYPPIFLALAGDGPKRDHISALARRLGVADRVMLLGDRADIPRLIAASAAGLQISRYEGYGLTAIEILAGRLPLIASDIPALRYATRGGARFIANDPQAIADAIMTIIDPASPDEFNETLLLSARGLDAARRRDIRHTADRYLQLYRQLLADDIV